MLDNVVAGRTAHDKHSAIGRGLHLSQLQLDRRVARRPTLLLGGGRPETNSLIDVLICSSYLHPILSKAFSKFSNRKNTLTDFKISRKQIELSTTNEKFVIKAQC